VKANAAYEELKRLGRRVAKPGVYRECDKLAELGFLTREADGYQAVEGMKIRTVEA
jgi:Fe2+ or Zn2+ uptake regulation protein